MVKQRTVKGIILFLLVIGLFSFTLLNGKSLASQRWIVTKAQSEEALAYAMQYVEHEVAYLFGGRYTIDEYLEAIGDGKEAGIEVGVDSSAVVLNSYRSAIPGISFRIDETGSRLARDISSSALYHYNTRHISLDQVRPGDLIFFKNSAGAITGVGIYSHTKGNNVVHFIVASANSGKVVLTNVVIGGNYWETRVAGFGRLEYSVIR